MLTFKLFRNSAFLLLVTIFLQSFSFLSIKYSTLQTGIISLLFLGFAIGFLGLRAILWQYLLRIADLSHVYPFAALVQPLILIYAVVLFNETVTPTNIAGLLVMLAGVYFMSRQE